MKKKTPAGKAPQTIDEYLAPLSSDKRKVLEALRKTIKAAAPKATESISYGVPTFKIDGKALIHFGAAAKHCSIYPGPKVIRDHQDELEAYSTSKGTIRFDPERPLPAPLVKKMVRELMASRISKKKAEA